MLNFISGIIVKTGIGVGALFTALHVSVYSAGRDVLGCLGNLLVAMLMERYEPDTVYVDGGVGT